MSSRLFTLHYCTIVAVATSDTVACVGHATVLYQLTDGHQTIYHTNRLSPYRYLHDRWPQLEPGRHVGRAGSWLLTFHPRTMVAMTTDVNNKQDSNDQIVSEESGSLPS